MKTFLLLICLFLFENGFTQSNDIYGIARNNNPNVTFLAKINTTTGLVEDVSDTSYSEYISNFSYTVDPFLGIFYYSGYNTFEGIDMNTGDLVYSNPITTSELPYFQSFIFNEVTGEIIGLERGGSWGSGQVKLAKINPVNGVVTTISPNSLAGTFVHSGYDIDIVNQWYHFFAEGKLLSVDVESGEIIHEPTVDTSQFANFNNLQYNAADGHLYAIGRNSSPAELFLVRLDPITGGVEAISPTSLGQVLELEGAAIDPFNEVFYFKRPNPSSLVGVDLNTGLEVSATPFDFSESNGAFFDYLYFGGITQSLILSTTEFQNRFQVELFPNPAQDFIKLKGDFIEKVELFSLTGKKIKQWKPKSNNDIQLDISRYNQGIYLLKVEGKNKEVKTFKLIKK